ncbi:MAG: 2OG-Fe(II) oxygenase [Planctomycetota bacterium]
MTPVTDALLHTLETSPRARLLDPLHWVYTVDGVLDAAECREWIARTEALGYGAAPITTWLGPVMRPEVRDNTRVMLDDPAVADWLWGRLQPWVPAQLDGEVAVGLNERLRFYRYEPGQKFDWHTDGYFRRDAREASKLTVLLYLGEGCEGGATEFASFLEVGPVRPEPGRALVFLHPIEHRGAPVRAGRKYVMRTDVMYREPPYGLEA